MPLRDKIAASKQRGLWVGGPAPLGYVIKEKKLVVDEKEAEQVRFIFQRYLESSGLSALTADLERKGIATKVRKLKTGKTIGGISFFKGPLSYLLKNRLYIGEVCHNGNVYKGQQAAIIDREVFAAVQRKLLDATSATSRKRSASDALLLGKIFDDVGNRMSPTRTQKGSMHYRFYISAPWRGKTATAAASRPRISAPGLERDVLKALRDKYPGDDGTSDRDMIERNVGRVVVSKEDVAIYPTAEEQKEDRADSNSIVIPISAQKRRTRREIIASGERVDDPTIGLRSENHRILVTAIAKGRRWADEILTGQTLCTSDIATREKCSERYVRDALGLAYLAPDIMSAVIENRLPPHLTVTRLRSDVPLSWAEQRLRFRLS